MSEAPPILTGPDSDRLDCKGVFVQQPSHPTTISIPLRAELNGRVIAPDDATTCWGTTVGGQPAVRVARV